MNAEGKHIWMLDVLEDLASYAQSHGLISLSISLATAKDDFKSALDDRTASKVEPPNIYRRRLYTESE